jgi:gas vesicle protein
MSVENEPQGAIGTSLIVFLLGVAVGATAAILYAPAAGTETRAQLAEKAEKLKDKASQVSERAVEWKDRLASRAKADGTAEPAATEAPAST